MTAVVRVLRIMEYLRTKKTPVRAVDLAERFEVCLRTIYRDLNTIREAGIHLDAEYGEGGGFTWFRFRPADWPMARLVRPRPPKDTMADPEAPTSSEPSASPVAQLNAITALHDFAAEMLRIRDAKIFEMQVEMERLAAELAASKADVARRDQRIAELEARIAEG